MALVTFAQERPGMVLSSAVKDQRGGRPREYRGCTDDARDPRMRGRDGFEWKGGCVGRDHLEIRSALDGLSDAGDGRERGPEAEERPAGTPLGASRTGDDSLPIFDLRDALERTGGDWETLNEVLDIFDEQWPVLEDRLDVGLATGDAEELRATAPLIRGAAANLSAKRIAWYAREAEQVWGTGTLEDAAERIRTIRKGVEEFMIEAERAREGAVVA